MAKTLLTLRDIVVRYDERVALRVPSLDIDAGDVLAIIGPNGAGKSTLLRVMGLLQRPSQGQVLLRGENGQGRNSLAAPAPDRNSVSGTAATKRDGL